MVPDNNLAKLMEGLAAVVSGSKFHVAGDGER